MSEFLAEASILIQAQTQAFRAELAAALATVPKEIVIPIVAVAPTGAGKFAEELAAVQTASSAAAAKTAVASGGVKIALEKEAAAAALAGNEEQKLETRRAGQTAVGAALAKTEKALATAKLEVAGAASAQEAAEITLQRQTAAAIAARELLTVAQLHGVEVEELLATTTVKEALAMGEAATATKAKAVADEQAAAAARHHAVQLSNVGRGAATSALAAVGLRGATLTANAAFIGGAAAAIGFGKAIQTATSFETNLNVFAATVGATGDQMEQVSEQAKQLGSDITLPSVSATDAADAMTELAKAGLSVQDSIAGARGVLQLATAAAIDNAQAVQIAASALNAFGLSGDQAVHVADVLANAANESQGSIADVGLSLQQAAAVSRQVGVSFEDTVALLTLLARNGIRGSDAGTSLRVAFTKLINPTEKARKVLQGLNVQIRDQAGNVRPEVFADFARAQQNLTKEQQDANAGIVFGTDALRAYSIAAREGTTGLSNVRDELDKQGTAAELAAARTKGLAGSVENLKNQLATLGLTIGDAVSGPITDFVDILAGGFENINAGLNFLNRLGGSADDTAQSFADLAQEAGKINFAVAAREGKAGQGLLDEQTKLNKALEESLGPGIKATSMIEGYRDALHSAALESESLRNRIDESTDRFAHAPAPPAPAPGPVPIGPSARFDRRVALAQASGDLEQIRAVQEEALARAKKAQAESHGNVEQRTKLFKLVTQAEADLASTNRQIAEKAAQKQESDATAAKAARQKADQAVLDQFAPGQNRIELATISANATDRLSDDIKVQNLIISTAEREKKIIEDTVKDVKTKNSEIAERVKTIREATAERDRLIEEAAKAATEKRKAAADALTESLGKQITLAGLRENDKAEIAAINKAITNARFRIRNYKKLGLNLLDEKIALEELINQRDEVNKTKDEANKGQGTTAFDLLKEAADTFNKSAGNLIGGNQPFAGPTGFTADIAQFLIRRQQPTVAPGPTSTASKSPVPPVALQDQPLIQAIERLTDAIIGTSGNASTAGGTASARQSRVWHSENLIARRFQEA